MTSVAGEARAPDAAAGWRTWGLAHTTVAVCLAFLALAVAFSLLTPAWENNDEASHVQYVEHVADHGTPPLIALGNGLESHQGPLYYYLAAGWQRLLGIGAFSARPPAQKGLLDNFKSGIYVYTHDYTAAQEQQAGWVHVLRVVSIACGLITVLAAVATGWLLTRRLAFAGAVGAAVALWPKFIVINSAVTNAALVDALCACAIPCFLLWRRARSPGWAAATGLALGGGALAAETALPIAGLMLALMIALGWRDRDWRGPLLAIACFAAVAGWWYVRNTTLYGDPLASAATTEYLREPLGAAPLVRTPPSLDLSVLGFGLKTLPQSTWYDAGWNQIQLPSWLGLAVSALAVVSLLGAAGARLRGRLLLALCALGSVVVWLLLLRATNQAEGRYLLVAVVAWAALLAAGSERLLARFGGIWLWPLLFLGLDVYVLARFLIPYAHL